MRGTGAHQHMVLAGALMVGLALGGFSTPPTAKVTRLDIAAPPRAGFCVCVCPAVPRRVHGPLAPGTGLFGRFALRPLRRGDVAAMAECVSIAGVDASISREVGHTCAAIGGLRANVDLFVAEGGLELLNSLARARLGAVQLERRLWDLLVHRDEVLDLAQEPHL